MVFTFMHAYNNFCKKFVRGFRSAQGGKVSDKITNFINKNPFVFVTALYVLAVIFVNPLGEFGVNDDWSLKRQIEAFLMGNFRISSFIDASFISQALIGFIWALVFGASFVSLRILTILITILFVYVCYEILKLLKVKSKLILITLLLLFFNPLVFTSSISFMTDNYFLLFFAFSIYFYLKSFETKRWQDIMFASIAAGLALLVRQLGIVIFIAYFLSLIMYTKPNLKITRNILVFVLPLLVFMLMFVYWPNYQESGGLEHLLSNLIELEDLPKRLLRLLMSIPYFAYFVLPVLMYKTDKKNYLVWIVGLVGVIYLTYTYYLLDVFPVGSVFYIENLHVKSNFKSMYSAFDNMPFKFFIAFLMSFGVFKFLLLLKDIKKPNTQQVFLLLNFLGMFTILAFGNDLYDRYLLPALLAFTFFILTYFENSLSKVSNVWVLVFLVIAVHGLLIQHEFMSHTRLRWKQAVAIQKETGYVNSIFVDGVYAKYFNAKKKGDYTGKESGDPPGKTLCYVLKYNVDTNTKYQKIMKWLDKQSQRAIENPRVYGSKKNYSLPSPKKHLDELKYNDEYFSPIYNIVGKKAYVGSWCEAKKK